MPTYEYECRSCGYKFEKFQNMTAVPIKKCPECGGDVKRLIGKGAGVIFKGSGFYATDYRDLNKTCGGRDEPCERPPCSDGSCKRE